jgi:hypothetical protein
MRRLLGFTLAALLFSIAGAPAQAGLLVLDFQGVTSTSSSLGSTPITPGTSYEVQATFDTATGTFYPNVKQYSYLPTSITATVGGTSYTVTDPGDFFVVLVGPINPQFPGLYLAGLLNNLDLSFFAPDYTTATPSLDISAPTPTVFSGYHGSLRHELNFSTTAGSLSLDYDPTVGINTSIIGVSTVPEPSSLLMTSVGGLMALGIWRRRRRAKLAA